MRSRTSSALGLLVAALWSVSSLAAGEARYELIDLGALAGGESTALAISDAGYVVGHSTIGGRNGVPERHAFLWLPRQVGSLGAGLHDLGTLDGVGSSAATGINDSLQISGWSEREAGSFDSSAFLWEDGEMTDLGIFSPGFIGSSSDGLNAQGEAVGSEGSGFACRPLIWLPDPAYGLPAGLNLVPRPAGFGEGYAVDINDSGEVVGTASLACDVAGTDAAFIWLPNDAYGLPAGAHELLPDEGDFVDTQAWAINNQGQVVGVINDASDSFTQQLFLWEAGDSTVLGNPTGDTLTQPREINDAGQIVGSTGPSFSNRTAFLWENGQFLDLNTFVPEGSDWVLATAFAINNQGWIVGQGTLDGADRAFLLRTPRSIPEIPTSSSFGLAALGSLLLASGLALIRRSRWIGSQEH